MRPGRRLTPQDWVVLEREADVRAKSKPVKQLAEELGFSEPFISKVLRELVRERRQKAHGP